MTGPGTSPCPCTGNCETGGLAPGSSPHGSGPHGKRCSSYPGRPAYRPAPAQAIARPADWHPGAHLTAPHGQLRQPRPGVTTLIYNLTAYWNSMINPIFPRQDAIFFSHSCCSCAGCIFITYTQFFFPGRVAYNIVRKLTN
jgi:hypothetical protein